MFCTFKGSAGRLPSSRERVGSREGAEPREGPDREPAAGWITGNFQLP